MITDSDMCALEVIFGQMETIDETHEVAQLFVRYAAQVNHNYAANRLASYLPEPPAPWTVGSSPAAQAEALADVAESERRQDLGMEEGPL